MQVVLTIRPDDSRTLQDRVFDSIREMILTGRIRAGDPVPGSRALAEQLSVSRNTVIFAYEKLLGEGYIEIRPNVGTFVSVEIPERTLTLDRATTTSTGLPHRPPSVFLDRIAEASFPVQSVISPAKIRLHTDFWVGRVDGRVFPATEWRGLMDVKVRHGGEMMAKYAPPEGILSLRRAIADHVGPARGIACTSENVVVVGGSQDGLMLLSRALAPHCRHFLHEDPGYQGARYLFAQSEFDCTAVPVDGQGLIVEALPETKHALLYVTPSHQFPTGVTMSLPRRLALLDWAERSDSLIVEDDYDGDFRYDGGPLTALHGLDRTGRVFYLGTFSKSMGPGLRLGYIVAPGATVPVLARWKQLLSNGVPWILQATMADFMESGAFQRHLRRLRVLYKGRRDALIGAIESYFPGSEIAGRRGGMHLSWRLPGGRHSRSLQRRALLRGIGIYTVEDGGACLAPGNDYHRDLLMLGYVAVEEGQIARAIAMLADIDCVNGE